jgi:hypothetical protein
VSTDRPVPPEPPDTDDPAPDFNEPVDVAWAEVVPPPIVRPKFQHKYRTHIILFLLTLVTMSFAEAFPFMWATIGSGENPLRFVTWDVFLNGLWYAVPMLVILGAHEFGHYYYCRKHNVDASLPYFLPAPIMLTGTLGAVIRIREPIPSKRALFDIGVSGPIAGFVALLPFLVIGLMMSEVAPKPEVSITLGEPLLFKVLAKFIVGPLPEGHDVFLHPLGFAAWFGMFATVLNLMPFGQLDGGHIAHALFGKRSVYVSAVTLVAMVVLTIISRTWMLMTIVMLVMAFSLGIRHPYVPDDGPLDENRQLLAAVALVIFIICFIPVPIEVFFRSQG